MKQTNAFGKSFSSIELASFCGQIALILKSGISALEGLNIMLEDTFSPEEEPILNALIDSMQETGSLYQALDETKLFPSYMIHMVQIGEETGTLDEVMAALQTHYEREDAVSKSIRSAVTYPMIMTGMMVAVIIVLLVKVMPIFNQVFVQLGSEMTGFSRMLMNHFLHKRHRPVFGELFIMIPLGKNRLLGRIKLNLRHQHRIFTAGIDGNILSGNLAKNAG